MAKRNGLIGPIMNVSWLNVLSSALESHTCSYDRPAAEPLKRDSAGIPQHRLRSAHYHSDMTVVTHFGRETPSKQQR